MSAMPSEMKFCLANAVLSLSVYSGKHSAKLTSVMCFGRVCNKNAIFPHDLPKAMRTECGSLRISQSIPSASQAKP